MQKINGAMHIICHLMNHYHHHLHHYINHSSLALNPHCMTFLCIIVLDVGCSWPHWGKCPLCSSVKSVWQVIFLRSFLDCIKARYKPSTVTGSRRRSNTLLWVNNYQMIGPQRAFEWMNLLKITSSSRVSESECFLSAEMEVPASRMKMKNRMSLLLIGELTMLSLQAEYDLFVRYDFKWLRSFKSTEHLTCTGIKGITFWCIYKSKIWLNRIWPHDTVLCLYDVVEVCSLRLV